MMMMMKTSLPCLGVLLSIIVAGSAGCAGKQGASTTRPLSAAERSDKALRDPFRYSPDWSDTDTGGSGTAELDRKGLQRDLGHVIMP